MALDQLNENATVIANAIDGKLKSNHEKITQLFAQHISSGEVMLTTTATRLVFNPATEDLRVEGGDQSLTVKPLEVQRKEAETRAAEREAELEAYKKQDVIRQEATRDIEELQIAHNREIAQLGTRHRQNIQEIRRKHEREEAKIRQEHQQQLALHQKLHQEDLRRLEDERNCVIRDYNAGVKQKQAEIDKISQENTGKRIKLQQELAEQKRAAENKIKELENSLERVRNQAQTDVNEAELRYRRF